MIAKIEDNIFAIKGNYYVYLINSNGLIIIDSSDSSDSSFIINEIIELSVKLQSKPKLLVLTSCKKEVAGGASFISNLFNIPVLASSFDAPSIRKGICENDSYPPVNVSIELKGNRIDETDILIIPAKSIRGGGIILKYKDVIFSGDLNISGIIGKVRYICNAFKFEKVEEPWFMKRDVKVVEGSQN
ncbi:MAG: MBL fold metallo-hydrolase [Sulfolobus sp.]